MHYKRLRRVVCMLDFKTALVQSGLLLDGAMGTELYKRGLFINRCFEQACLSDQSLVMQVHRLL